MSSFTQTSSESRKIYMAKDAVLTDLCLCTSLLRVLYKKCKHTRDLTRMWVALNLVVSTINNGPTQLILPIDVHYLIDHHCGPGDMVQPHLH